MFSKGFFLTDAKSLYPSVMDFPVDYLLLTYQNCLHKFYRAPLLSCPMIWFYLISKIHFIISMQFMFQHGHMVTAMLTWNTVSLLMTSTKPIVTNIDCTVMGHSAFHSPAPFFLHTCNNVFPIHIGPCIFGIIPEAIPGPMGP